MHRKTPLYFLSLPLMWIMADVVSSWLCTQLLLHLLPGFFPTFINSSAPGIVRAITIFVFWAAAIACGFKEEASHYHEIRIKQLESYVTKIKRFAIDHPVIVSICIKVLLYVFCLFILYIWTCVEKVLLIGGVL